MLANSRRPLRRALLVGSTAVSILQGLFLLGEPGWVYDPSQLDTMFQDIAGTTPVTGPGDPVGLNLDKRLWGGRSLAQVIAGQPELVTNGDFDTDTVWSKGAGWTIAGGVAQAAAGSTSNIVTPASVVTVGKLYEITFTVAGRTAGSLTPLCGSTGTGASVSANGTFTQRLLAATDTSLYFQKSSTFNGTLDKVSVKEIPGFHRGQATSAARPTLARVPYGGRRNLMTRTQELDNAVWNKPNSTVQANATTAPDGTLTADKIVEDGSSSPHGVWSNNPVVTGITYTGSAYLKAAGRNFGMLYTNVASGGRGRYFSLPADGSGQVLGNYSENATAGTIEYVGNGWYRCSITWTETATTEGRSLEPYASINGSSVAYAGDSASGIYAWGLQLEPGSNPTAYQKVTSTHDVTEIGKADCWYFSYDGTDDHFVSLANLNPGTDKAVIASAFRKNVDHTGLIVEQTANYNSGTTGGRFAHLTDTGNIYRAGHNNGSISYAAYTSGAFTGAHSAVLMTTHDLAGSTRDTELPLFEINGASGKNAVAGTYGDNNPNWISDLVYWGRRGGSSSPFNGMEFQSVARFAAIPDASQIAALRTYMANKAGYAL